MNIVTVVRSALQRTGSSMYLVMILYVANLLASLPLALAFGDLMTEALGPSLAVRELAGGFDFTVIRDLLARKSIGLDSLMSVLSWSLPVYLVVNILLTGGVLSWLIRPEARFTSQHFFQECGRYILRFLRVSLFLCAALLFLAAVPGIPMLILLGLVTTSALSEVTVLTVFVLCATVLFVAASLLLLVADYARIFVVTSGERRMWSAIREGLRFLRKEFFGVVGLQVLLLVFPAACTGIYLLLASAVPMTSGLTIVVVLLFQQLYIASRMWTRVLTSAGQSALYIRRAVP